jgi:hypothetical protein
MTVDRAAHIRHRKTAATTPSAGRRHSNLGNRTRHRHRQSPARPHTRGTGRWAKGTQPNLTYHLAPRPRHQARLTTSRQPHSATAEHHGSLPRGLYPGVFPHSPARRPPAPSGLGKTLSGGARTIDASVAVVSPPRIVSVSNGLLATRPSRGETPCRGGRRPSTPIASGSARPSTAPPDAARVAGALGRRTRRASPPHFFARHARVSAAPFVLFPNNDQRNNLWKEGRTATNGSL